VNVSPASEACTKQQGCDASEAIAEHVITENEGIAGKMRKEEKSRLVEKSARLRRKEHSGSMQRSIPGSERTSLDRDGLER